MNIKPLFLSVLLATIPFAAFSEVVNINKASAATLQHYLKGIGQKKAESIVMYRTEHKEFKALDEIMKVKGIGKGIYKNIKPDLSLRDGKVAVVKVAKKTKKVKVVAQSKKQDDVELELIKPSSVTLEKVAVDTRSVKNDSKVTKVEVKNKSTK